MSKLSDISKNHVLDVCNGLNRYLLNESITAFNEITQETVKYIFDLYPNIRIVRSKFETEQPDFNPDLLLTLSNKQLFKAAQTSNTCFLPISLNLPIIPLLTTHFNVVIRNIIQIVLMAFSHEKC